MAEQLSQTILKSINNYVVIVQTDGHMHIHGSAVVMTTSHSMQAGSTKIKDISLLILCQFIVHLISIFSQC